jgi:predicted ferric reductase
VVQNIPPLAEIAAHYPNVFITDFEHAPYIAAQGIADMLKRERLSTVYVPTVEKMADSYMKLFKED